MTAYPRLRQRLLGGLLTGVIAYVVCTAAGIGAPQEVPFEAAFGLVVGVIATPGRRGGAGANTRLYAVAFIWLTLLGIYLMLLAHSVD